MASECLHLSQVKIEKASTSPTWHFTNLWSKMYKKNSVKFTSYGTLRDFLTSLDTDPKGLTSTIQTAFSQKQSFC